MDQGKHRGGAEPPVAEPEPDIDQHQNHGDDDGRKRIRLHLLTDGGADGLALNIRFLHTERRLELLIQLLPLTHVQAAGLDDDLITSCDSLHLHIGVAGDFFKDRDNLVIQLFQCVALVERDAGGCTADKIKAVIEGPLSPSRIDAHREEAAQDHTGRDGEEEFSVLQHIQLLRLLPDAVELHIGEAEVEQCLHEPLRHKERGEHGQKNTYGKRLGKALDSAGAAQSQNKCGNQRGDIAVDDGGQCLVVADPDGGIHRLAGF